MHDHLLLCRNFGLYLVQNFGFYERFYNGWQSLMYLITANFGKSFVFKDYYLINLFLTILVFKMNHNECNWHQKKGTSLRLNSNLYDYIEKLAKKENRSLNNFIETTLFDALEYREPNEDTKKGIAESRKERAILKRYSDVEELFQDVEDEL